MKILIISILMFSVSCGYLGQTKGRKKHQSALNENKDQGHQTNDQSEDSAEPKEKEKSKNRPQSDQQDEDICEVQGESLKDFEVTCNKEIRSIKFLSETSRYIDINGFREEGRYNITLELIDDYTIKGNDRLHNSLSFGINHEDGSYTSLRLRKQNDEWLVRQKNIKKRRR